jgi:hypothetical protein
MIKATLGGLQNHFFEDSAGLPPMQTSRKSLKMNNGIESRLRNLSQAGPVFAWLRRASCLSYVAQASRLCLEFA